MAKTNTQRQRAYRQRHKDEYNRKNRDRMRKIRQEKGYSEADKQKGRSRAALWREKRRSERDADWLDASRRPYSHGNTASRAVNR